MRRQNEGLSKVCSGGITIKVSQGPYPRGSRCCRCHRFHTVASYRLDGPVRSALNCLQDGLDMSSIFRRADLATRDAPDEYFAWWRDGGKRVIAVVDTGTFSFHVPPISIEVRDVRGQIVPPTPVTPAHRNASSNHHRPAMSLITGVRRGTAHKIPGAAQYENGASARSDNSPDAARHRRRGDRMMGWMAPLRHRRAKLVSKSHQEREPSMSEITTIGLDLAKHVFQVHGFTRRTGAW